MAVGSAAHWDAVEGGAGKLGYSTVMVSLGLSGVSSP